MYNINPSSTCTVQPDSRKKVISVDFFKLRIKGLSHYMCIYTDIHLLTSLGACRPSQRTPGTGRK